MKRENGMRKEWKSRKWTNHHHRCCWKSYILMAGFKSEAGRCGSEKRKVKKEKEAGNGHFIKKNESVRVSTNSLCKEQSCWTTNGLKIVPQNYSPHLCWSSSVYFNKLSDWLIACHVIRFGQSECPDAWAARTEAVNFNFNRWTVFWDTFRIKFWQVLACMYVVCVFVMTSSNFRSWLLPNSYLVDQKSWQKMIA